MEKKLINITLRGQVQGVGFRYFIKSTADELKVCGLARNQADGSLYIEVEGEPSKLNIFLERCKQGPASAQVKESYVLEGEVKDYHDFRIAL